MGCLMSSVLEPGEQPVAYADRGLPEPLIAHYDAFAYETSERGREVDAMAYAAGPANAHTDAFAYARGPRTRDQDAMAHGGGEGDKRHEDAMAYEAASVGAHSDAFVAHPGGHREETPVDAMLLTDRRLIRAIVEEDKITLLSAPVALMGIAKIRVEARYDQAADAVRLSKEPAYLSIELPGLLRVQGEGPWWTWQLREDLDPWTEFTLWRGGKR